MNNLIKTTVLSTSLFALSTSGLLAVINFEIQNAPADDKELLPGVTYTDGGATFQFGIDVDGLTNGLDRGSNTYANMFIEATGTEVGPGAVNGFQQGDPLTSTVFDNDIDPSADLGEFFLRTNGFGSTSPLDGEGLFVIEYIGTGVNQASGEIWDIDGQGPSASEVYLVQAWNSGPGGLTEVDSVRSDDPTILGGAGWSGETLDGDGLAWRFQLNSIAAAIDYITIDFVGTKTEFIGLAFDNFNATQVPEPGLFGLISGVFALGWVMCRRRVA